MYKVIQKLLFLPLLLCSTEAATEGLRSVSDNLKNNSRSVVKITVTNADNRPATGTGFVWHSNEYLLTTFHTVINAKKIEVFYEQLGVSRSAELRSFSPDHDLALLKIKNPPEVVPLQVETRDIISGTNAFVLSFPRGISAILSRRLNVSELGSGSLQDILNNETLQELESAGLLSSNPKILNIEGPLTFGDSGAPIFDENGNKVIAVANGGLAGGAIDIAWGIPNKYFDSVLKEEAQGKADAINYEGIAILFANYSAKLNKISDLLDSSTKLKLGVLPAKLTSKLSELITPQLVQNILIESGSQLMNYELFSLTELPENVVDSELLGVDRILSPAFSLIEDQVRVNLQITDIHTGAVENIDSKFPWGSEFENELSKLWTKINRPLVIGEFEHDGEVVATKFSPSTKYLLSFTNKNSVYIWNLETKSLKAKLENRNFNTIWPYAHFSPNEQYLATWLNQDGKVTNVIYDLQTDQHIPEVAGQDDEQMKGFCTDNDTFYTFNEEENIVRKYVISSGLKLDIIASERQFILDSVSKDCDRLIIQYRERDSSTIGGLSVLEFAPEFSVFSVKDNDASFLNRIEAHDLSHYGDWYVSQNNWFVAKRNGEFLIYDFDGVEQESIQGTYVESINGNPDWISFLDEEKLYFRNVNSGEVVNEIVLGLNTGRSIVFSPSSRTFYLSDGQLSLYDFDSGFKRFSASNTYEGDFSTGGRYFTTWSGSPDTYKEGLSIYDIDNDKASRYEVEEFGLETDDLRYYGVVGNYVVIGSDLGDILLFDIELGEVVSVFSVSLPRTIFLRNLLEDGEQKKATRTELPAISISPDFRKLATPLGTKMSVWLFK